MFLIEFTFKLICTVLCFALKLLTLLLDGKPNNDKYYFDAMESHMPMHNQINS
jgi:hypothetical protein